MKTLISLLLICFLSTAFAEDKKEISEKDKETISKVWKEMHAEKKKYAEMKKDGASEKELELQEKLINELYKTVLDMKGVKEKDIKEKKDFGGEAGKVWKQMLTEKKKYSIMEKKGASKEELEAQEKVIEELYEKVIKLKKEK
jgi:hypothetical protein